MSTATTTSHDTGQQTSPRGLHGEAQQPVTQPERYAAQRLRTPFVPVRLAVTWLGVRKTLAPEQRTMAARAFHADRELLSASKLILDTSADTGPVGEPVLRPFGNRTDVLGRSGSGCFSQQSGRFRLTREVLSAPRWPLTRRIEVRFPEPEHLEGIWIPVGVFHMPARQRDRQELCPSRNR